MSVEQIQSINRQLKTCLDVLSVYLRSDNVQKTNVFDAMRLMYQSCECTDMKSYFDYIECMHIIDVELKPLTKSDKILSDIIIRIANHVGARAGLIAYGTIKSVDDSTKHVDDSMKNVAELTKQVDDLTKQNKVHNKEYVELNEQIYSSELTLLKKKEECEALKQQLSEKNAECEALKQQLSEKDKQRIDEITKLDDMIEDSYEENAKLGDQCDKYHKDSNELGQIYIWLAQNNLGGPTALDSIRKMK